jgi:phospholipid-transporting ATPase
MISTAHIGIGILGREGLQAAKVSDYAIAQFSFLRRLLLVHGRECYRKNSFVVIYTFYKNILIIAPQIAFGYYSLFSAQSIYNEVLFNAYNIIFSTFPLVWFAIADKEYTYKVLEKNPVYYIQGIKGKSFSTGRFWKWVLVGAVQGTAVLIFMTRIDSTMLMSGMIKDINNLGNY